jgi:transcriptional regulator with XRE-family HTH domain
MTRALLALAQPRIDLRALRKAAGLTQAELAKRAGLTQPHIAQLERSAGMRTKLRTLQRYVKAAGARLKITAVVGTERIGL